MTLTQRLSDFADGLTGGLQRRLEEADRRYSVLAENALLMKERLAELELALDDDGWQRLGLEDREFSREGLKRICKLCRLMFLQNPLVNRAVTLTSIYVFAQGVQVRAEDEAADAVLQKFLSDPRNMAELAGHQARTLKEQELEVTGNLFFVFFTDATGRVLIRTIPVDEVQTILTDPEDSKAPRYYFREWTVEADPATRTPGGPMRAYYPDVDWAMEAAPGDRPDIINAVPVRWDSPVYHVKIGGLPDMRFGVPEVYQGIFWARAYKEFLTDWTQIVKALSRFAMHLTTPSKKKADEAATKLGTTLATGANWGRADANPPPVAGSYFISDEGVKLEPIRTAGATVSAEDGRRLLLMFCASCGLPETFFGDVQTGNLATAQSLDRPTELKFRDRQELWRAIYQRIGRFVIERNTRAPGSELALQTPVTEVTVSFPPILERDMAAVVKAWTDAATLAGKPSQDLVPRELVARGMLAALGVENIDDVLAEWEQENPDIYQPQPAPPPAPNPFGPASPVSQPGTLVQSDNATVAEALAELRAALRELREAA